MATAAAQPPAKRPVIIDTDMAADDWMAILFLLRHPGVEVIAITVTGAGEAHCAPGVRHALGLLALAKYGRIPVTCGRETPLQGNHVFPQAWRDNVDNLAGLSLPANPNPPSKLNAVELLTTTLETASVKPTILALGPLTNLAEAFEAKPALADKIEMIYIMGGVVDVPGNIYPGSTPIDNPHAEWNIYVDPLAASRVIQSGAPVTLVPLDATNHAPLDLGFYRCLESQHTTPEAQFLYDLLTRNKGFIESGGYYFWDPLAAAILVDERLTTIQTRMVAVVEAEGRESGRTRPVRNGSQVRVAVAADRERFTQVFLDTLNGETQ